MAVVVKTVLGSYFGVGAAPILVNFSEGWDAHWGYGILTHGQMRKDEGSCWLHRVLLEGTDI